MILFDQPFIIMAVLSGFAFAAILGYVTVEDAIKYRSRNR
jgi:predicted membrane protein